MAVDQCTLTLVFQASILPQQYSDPQHCYVGLTIFCGVWEYSTEYCQSHITLLCLWPSFATEWLPTDIKEVVASVCLLGPLWKLDCLALKRMHPQCIIFFVSKRKNKLRDSRHDKNEVFSNHMAQVQACDCTCAKEKSSWRRLLSVLCVP